jgi:hypothetical protein
MAVRIDAEVTVTADPPAWGPAGEPIPGEAATAQVSREDIEDGERCECLKCPVALALARVWPGAAVAVTGDFAYVYASRAEYEDAETQAAEVWSHDAVVFIDRFDYSKPVEPREVHVRLLQRRR